MPAEHWKGNGLRMANLVAKSEQSRDSKIDTVRCYGIEDVGENYRPNGDGWKNRFDAISIAARENRKAMGAIESLNVWAVAVEVGEQIGDELFQTKLGPDGIGSIDTQRLIRPIRRIEPTKAEREILAKGGAA